jgi:AcrR family transcriptional regulator
MKSDAVAEKRRAYDNRLREAQARQTRERILGAVTELVADGRIADLTMAEIASRAGVSEPTIYRHFGSREQLYDELDQHIRSHVGLPELPVEFATIPRVVFPLFEQFEQNGALLRAAMKAGLSREVRERGKTKRHQKMRQVISPYTSRLCPSEARAVAAVYRLLISWEAWDRLTGEFGVSAETAAEAVGGALTALNEKLVRDYAARRTTLRAEPREKK